MFNSLQVLRTKVPLKDANGNTVKPKTRVVFIKSENGKAVTRMADGRFGSLKGVRVVAGSKAFTTTHRGRPRKSA